MLRHLVNFSVLALTGCASLGSHFNAERIPDIDQSLPNIRVNIANVAPGGIRSTSPNGRELQSRHFLPDRRGGYRAATDALERYYVHYTILGDRRPYSIEVLVTKEERVLRGNQFTYVVVGHDQRLAKELADRLYSELTKRREERNIIDDFRVY